MSFRSSNNPVGDFLSDVFTESGTPVRVFWQIAQGILIFVSCLSMLLENYEPYQSGFSGFITGLELTAVAFLTVDYLGSLYFSEERLKYVFSFWGLVDLLAVVPFYLMLLNPNSAVMVKALRSLRFVRLLVIWRIAKGRF